MTYIMYDKVTQNDILEILNEARRGQTGRAVSSTASSQESWNRLQVALNKYRLNMYDASDSDSVDIVKYSFESMMEPMSWKFVKSSKNKADAQKILNTLSKTKFSTVTLIGGSWSKFKAEVNLGASSPTDRIL